MNKDINTIHYSVMLEESIDSLELKKGLTVVDCTVNRAGHAERIAKKIGSTGTLIIIDLDRDALSYSYEKLKALKDGPKVLAFHSNYRNIKECLEKAGLKSVDRIFADLGLSSQELDVSGRGFSFLRDEPLHMTFQSEVSKDTFTAKDLINNLPVSSLEQIFKVYGDEQKAWRIANAIVEERDRLSEKRQQISTTGQLVKIIESVVPRSGKSHPATKVFQAIRIAVNDEYEGIKQLVTDGYELLNKKGIFSIITFHSGEDRIVKNMFKAFETKDNKQDKFKPTRKEVLENKRSRSALLRKIKKI